MKKDIFISFVEEAVMNPKYPNYIAGRIEVSHPGDVFPSQEIRWFTNAIEAFNELREKWDMKKVTGEELGRIRELIGLHHRRV